MTLAVNAKTYTGDSFAESAVGYNGPAHTVSVKDLLVLKRTRPKPSSVFSGVGRTEAKLTRTHNLTGSLTPTGEMIASMNVSMPVGAASADVDSLLNDMGALISSASFKAHVKSQQVSF